MKMSKEVDLGKERIGALKDLLFFDIETTGLSGDTSQDRKSVV